MQLQISSWHEQDARVLRKMDGVQLIMTRYTLVFLSGKRALTWISFARTFAVRLLMWENEGQEQKFSEAGKV